MPTNQPTAVTDPSIECLWDLLQVAAERETRWRTDHQETGRRTYRASWDIWITCPGSRHEGVRPTPGTWGRCTPTVLACDTGDDDNHLAYRGACLGCGWVAERVHLIGHGGENGGSRSYPPGGSSRADRSAPTGTSPQPATSPEAPPAAATT